MTYLRLKGIGLNFPPKCRFRHHKLKEKSFPFRETLKSMMMMIFRNYFEFVPGFQSIPWTTLHFSERQLKREKEKTDELRQWERYIERDRHRWGQRDAKTSWSVSCCDRFCESFKRFGFLDKRNWQNKLAMNRPVTCSEIHDTNISSYNGPWPWCWSIDVFYSNDVGLNPADNNLHILLSNGGK